MIPVEAAIHHFRRGLTFSALLRFALVGSAIASVLLGRFFGQAFDEVIALSIIGFIWLLLSVSSAKGSRLVADSPSLIATGQFDQAERQIDEALRSFSLFRTVKFVSLHHLAVLRHAQRRWQESAMLCRALLRHRLRGLEGLSKPSQLILADALLEMGDTRGAHDAMRGLYQQRLSLGELLNLLLVQLDYQARIGDWTGMMSAVMAKVQLAELLPPQQAARAQAFLALAAKRCGRDDWADWLRRRAELLADTQRLAAERPIIGELWEKKDAAESRPLGPQEQASSSPAGSASYQPDASISAQPSVVQP